MSVGEEQAGAPASTRCEECGAPLLHDQRYCVACGARRGPLPAAIAALIAAGLHAGTAYAGGEPREDSDLFELAAEPEDQDRSFAHWMPAPRAAALAVMALLAFGVVVGSVVSPPAESAATAPVLVALSRPAASSPPVTHASASDSSPAADAAAPVDTSPAPSPAPAPASGGGDAGPPPSDGPALPEIRHVFLIVLSGHGFDDAFGAGSAAPYLAQDLPRQGELLANYYGVAQSELANGIALISGQGPTAQTAASCPQYGDVAPGTLAGDGQVAGDGCVYPAKAQTLADQLTAAGRTWRAYVEDVGNGPAGEATTCRHPALGAPDGEQAPRAGDAYVTWRNPFVYFHSLIDGPACGRDDVGLDRLARDLRSADTTPSLAYIVPNRCHDGAEEPCAPGRPAGLAATDAFLRTVVPEIERSPAYQDGGLIAITFDEAPQSGPHADSGSCCDAQPFPNLAPGSTAAPGGPTTTTVPAASTTPTATAPASPATPPTTTTPAPSPPAATTPATTTPAATPATPPGGGRVGLLLISPSVEPGTVNQTEEYNHFSLLRSIEDLFGLQHLGYAADPALPAFDKVVYNAKPKPPAR